MCIAPSVQYLCQCQRVWCALVGALGPSQLRLLRHSVSWSFRITPLFLLLMPGLKMKVLHFHACYLAWLLASVVLMLWVSFLFCCSTLMFPRLTLYVFFVVMVRLHCILRRISLPCRASSMVCMVYFGLPSAVDACSWRLAWPKQEQNMVSVILLAFREAVFGAPWGAKMPQDVAKRPQAFAKRLQDVAKRPQDGPNMAPRRLQDGLRRPKMASRRPQEDFKMASRGFGNNLPTYLLT